MTETHDIKKHDPETHDRENIADIWPFLIRPNDVALPEDPHRLQQAAQLLADLASPILTDFLLSPVAVRLGRPLIDPQAVARDRIASRFALSQQLKWAAFLAASGMEIAFIKGFANAHLFYPDPVLRMQGDLDILVRETDLAPLIDLLAEEGFRFQPAPLNSWGMISDASFAPFVSADGACNIDIHIQPDCYPAHRSLNADRLFHDARPVSIGECSVLMPSPEHVLLLCATNSAKDKFDLVCLRKAVDAIVALRAAPSVDWNEIVDLARKGRFLLPLRVFFAILVALGLDPAPLPDVLRAPITGLRRRAMDQVVAQFRLLFPDEPPLTTLLWREALLCAEPSVAGHNLLLRARGLVRPATGIPDGAPVEGRP